VRDSHSRCCSVIQPPSSCIRSTVSQQGRRCPSTRLVVLGVLGGPSSRSGEVTESSTRRPARQPPAMFTIHGVPNWSVHMPNVSPHICCSSGMATVPPAERGLEHAVHDQRGSWRGRVAVLARRVEAQLTTEDVLVELQRLAGVVLEADIWVQTRRHDASVSRRAVAVGGMHRSAAVGSFKVVMSGS
jgi:hypothetical protein